MIKQAEKKPATGSWVSARRAAYSLGLCVLLTGCFNQASTTVDLGSVSLGQQLMDLKKARDTNSLSNEEYEKARAALMFLLENAAEEEDFEPDLADNDSGRNSGKSKNAKDDDDDSGFLF